MHAFRELTWEEFQEKFRQAYGREMTAPERERFYAIWIIVSDGRIEQSKGVAA
jgi:hypothetical protein